MTTTIETLKNHINKVEARSGWTIRQWEKEDPEGLKTLKDLEPERYNTMFQNYYKPTKTNN
jgi:hypothetical protein